MKKAFFICLIVFSLCLGGTIAVVAQKASVTSSPVNLTAKYLDDYLSRMSGFGFSGAVIVEKDGRVILRKGYGFADRAKRVPFTVNTPFPVDSISKQFTAAAILRLEESGKLSLCDPISKFLNNVPADKSGITIHQLLTHTSGFGDNYAGANIFDRENAVNAILKPPLDHPVGTKFLYSNDGYELLAAIAEIVSREPLFDFIRHNLFNRAGMKTAGFRGDGDFWKGAAVAHGYNSYVDNGSPQFGKRDWDGPGAGDLVVSAADLFRWELALRANKALSTYLKGKMFKPYAALSNGWHYGYGWFIIKTDRGTKEYYHGGGDVPRGYTSSFSRYPEEKATIIIFSNNMIDQDGFLRAVKGGIVDITFGKKVVMPPDFIDVDSSQLPKYAGTYKSESGEKFIVQVKGYELLIGAIGQNSIDFLTDPDEPTKEKLENYNRSVPELMAQIKEGSNSELTLPTTFDSLEKSLGKYKGYETLGTYPVSFSSKVSTTFVKMSFEKGEEVIRLVNAGTDDPYPMMGCDVPALTPIRQQNKGNFVAYYPFLRKAVQVKFTSGRDNKITGMKLENGNGSRTARRE